MSFLNPKNAVIIAYMQDAIKQWLSSGQNYAQGVDLYKEHYGDDYTFRMLQRGENSFSREKLLDKLRSAVQPRSANPVDKPFRAKPNKQQTIAITTRKAKDHYPEDLHAAYQRQEELYALVNHLHPQLEALYKNSRKKCTDVAITIKKAWAEIKSIYRLLDYWSKHQVVLPNTYNGSDGYEITDPVEMKTRIYTLRTYISKSRNRPEKHADIIKWTKEMESLQVKLDRHDY